MKLAELDVKLAEKVRGLRFESRWAGHLVEVRGAKLGRDRPLAPRIRPAAARRGLCPVARCRSRESRSRGLLMHRRSRLLTVVISAALTAALAACGSNPSAGANSDGKAGSSGNIGGSDNAGESGSGSGSGTSGSGNSLNVEEMGEGGTPLPGDLTNLSLQVSLEKSSVVVQGAPLSVVAHAQFDDGSMPQSIIWSVNNTRLGSIGDDGVFEANGFAAGLVVITAQVGTVSASADLQISVEIDKNPDNLSEAERAALTTRGVGGGHDLGPDSTFRFLYPYDNTVFPRGLSAPTLQFASAGATATHLQITTDGFSVLGASLSSS